MIRMKIIGFEFLGNFGRESWKLFEKSLRRLRDIINIRMIGMKIIGFEFFGEFWNRKLKVVWQVWEKFEKIKRDN